MTFRCRMGFSVIEILVAVAVMSVVGAVILTTISRQQRLLHAAAEELEMRGSVRDAISVLGEEIRGASARDTVRLMSDSAIEFFSALGSSVVCASPSSSDISLAPVASPGFSLTSWLAVPDTGDLALVYRAGSSTPGTWERYRILVTQSRSTQTTCPAASGLSDAPGASASTFVLTLSPPPSVPVPGSPVRFIRRGRYSLYRSSDKLWYLGYRRCNAIGPSICGGIQPVSGYYRPFSRDTSQTGILFRFLDAAGGTIAPGADPLRLARVQISVHATSSVPVPLDVKAKNAADSMTVSAALRNIP